MKYEIEVKARVKDLPKIIFKLEQLGCILSPAITQIDYVYNQKGINLKDRSHKTPVLRIREQGKRIVFTLKINRGNELDCIEKEIAVSDKNALKEMIELLGFTKTVEVHKKRQKGTYDDYEICVDEVEGLGTFIEVEKMSSEDGEKVQNKLFGFLEKLGITKDDHVMLGYDSQLWLKNNEN